MEATNKPKRTLREDLKMLLRGYKLLYTICPANMVYRTLYILVCTLMPYFPLYMSAWLIDEIAAGAPFRRLLTLALINVFGSLALRLLRHVAQRKADEYNSINYQLNYLHILKAQNRMQYSHFEDPETALLIASIRNHSNYGGHGLDVLYWRYWQALSALIDIVASVALTASMLTVAKDVPLRGFLAFINSPWSALLIAVLIALSIAVQYISVHYFEPRSYALWTEQNNRSARNDAYFGRDCPDARIFNTTRLSLIHSEQTYLRESFLRAVARLGLKNDILRQLFQFILDASLFIYVGAKAFIGVLGIGSFVLYRGTVEKFVNAVSSIGGTLDKLRRNNDYVADVFRLLDLPDEMYHGTLSVEKRDDTNYEIEFRHVSFRYPGAQTEALHDVSFKFRVGERLAFVGMNGSGKSTFVKLLCRLYDPSEGKILLNGIDITRYKYDEYMRLFSVVFQDFSLFDFSLGENLAAGEPLDEERAAACLEKAGLGERFRKLTRGLDTPIGYGYQNDGEEMSGGERQKIAIARALYKNAPFIILDEPTAALDPLAEAEIYSQFNEIVDNKTAIYISHRLSSCRFCDRIVVFHEGRLIEQGEHDALVADKTTKYHQLWHAQAQYYV